jgi:hypothetical protein
MDLGICIVVHIYTWVMKIIFRNGLFTTKITYRLTRYEVGPDL